MGVAKDHQVNFNPFSSSSGGKAENSGIFKVRTEEKGEYCEVEGEIASLSFARWASLSSGRTYGRSFP